MTALIFQLLGGIGLFLMGMVLLTDGLKSFAGESLKRALVKFTGTPVKAFFSGALVTVLVQSSSATTITVIGFVSAGLITFAQSVGIVLGASLGTTGTGWIIATLGLKISIGFYSLPLVGIGALLRLLAKGRPQALGLALAGFGLIFIGIDTLQEGMSGLSGYFNLAALPGGNFFAYLVATLLGIVMTVVMQSSSAAVATTLTALHAGAISFEHAAALVIGAAIGTTVTGALAAIGGSTAAKRTALTHVGFNLFTGLIALILLPFFLALIRYAQDQFGLDPGAISLAAFHTLFISFGVLLVLPFVGPLSRKIEALLPEKESLYVRRIDESLLSAPEVALEASLRSLRDLASASFLGIAHIFPNGKSLKAQGPTDKLSLLRATDKIQSFLQRIPESGDHKVEGDSVRVNAFHALEHLNRLQSRVEPPASIQHTLNDPELSALFDDLTKILDLGSRYLADYSKGDKDEDSDGNNKAIKLSEIQNLSQSLADFRRDDRPKVMEQTAAGKISSSQSLDRLDAVRWIDRIGYHTWRICEHLSF